MKEAFNGTFNGLEVLVTGNTGFKGSWLSVWLNELGANVIGYSNGVPTIPNNFELSHLKDRIKHIQADIRNLEKLEDTIKTYKPELVIHLAAQPIVLRSYEEPKETFDTNVGGTVNVLDAVKRNPFVKALVCITSDKCYADQEWAFGYRENDILGGHDPYSASKAMSEIAIKSFNNSFFLPNKNHPTAVASARAGNVIGGGDFADYRLVPDCMKALMDNKRIEVRNPESIRPWQIMLEPLSGYLSLAAHLLEYGNEDAEGWNFGPLEKKGITAKEIVEESIRLWGSGDYFITSDAPKQKETKMLRLSWDKAASILNWEPSYTWKEALSQTVSWFKTLSENKGKNSFDMYEKCAADIEDYTQRARTLGREWAL